MIFNYSDNKYISVTNETIEKTPYTFNRNGNLWEKNSINYFFKDIDDNKKYNIIDVGAQSGLYSLYSKYLPKSMFYSFEPFPETFKLLNDNINLNDINNVKTYNIALSDKKGYTKLNTCLTHYGLHTMGENVKRFNDIKQIDIETDTIDNIFFNNNIPVDYIKIDTEGWEYFVLTGGINTILKYKPKIQIEWNVDNITQCNITPQMLINLIDKINYKVDTKINEELFLVPK